MERALTCPNDNYQMTLKTITKVDNFRDVEIEYPVKEFVCPECGLEVADKKQTAKIQKAISDAYRKKVNLLTGEEIVRGRKRLGLSQEALANLANIGVASIKRWEAGLIQTRPMDDTIRRVLQDNPSGFIKYRGNRKFSIPRIKRVAKEFEHCLGRELLVDGDKLLYTGKDIWYADMVAFRELSKGMTGARYAALPQGPQLDNYAELAEYIMKADESKSEPLTDKEKAIIKRVSDRFPNIYSAYKASHREPLWKKIEKEGLIGYPISYFGAYMLEEI